MSKRFKNSRRLVGALLLGLGLLPQAQAAGHAIRGITPNGAGAFNLYAAPFNINLSEGSSLYMWGFGDLDGGANASPPDAGGSGFFLPQYPAPTLIVAEGEPVTINLTNYGVPDSLSAPGDNPVSIVVAGHNVTATDISDVGCETSALCTAGLFTGGATYGQTVKYTFTAGTPGTYVYHSLGGPDPGLHVEMGLTGALIVRPADGSQSANGAGTGTDFDQEYLYFLTEADPDIHFQMERGHYGHFSRHNRYATIYFVNGRVYPDLVQEDFLSSFPHQPYRALAFTHPLDRTLVRNVNGGHDSHPFHYHGENHRFIGRDGGMLSSDGVVADLGRSDNTINSAPKQTVDAIWTWSGRDLGWDAFGTTDGHLCNDLAEPSPGFDPVTKEYCPDHGKAFPVDLPGASELTFGGYWSGSPFLGATGDLPPGEGGLNPNAGYFFLWHSHAEKELTTFDIFPGGSLSAVVVLPTSVDIQ